MSDQSTTPLEKIYTAETPIEKVVINFTKTSDDGLYSFSDTIILRSNHKFTESDIESIKQERFDNWLSYILAPVADSSEPIV